MVGGVIYGDGREEGCGVIGGHDLVGLELDFFCLFNEFKRVFTDKGVVLDEGFQDIVKKGGKVFLGGINMGCYQASRVILGRFVGLDSRVSRWGGRSRGVDILISLVIKFIFFFELTEFILDFSFKGISVIGGIQGDILKLFFTFFY